MACSYLPTVLDSSIESSSSAFVSAVSHRSSQLVDSSACIHLASCSPSSCSKSLVVAGTMRQDSTGFSQFNENSAQSVQSPQSTIKQLRPNPRKKFKNSLNFRQRHQTRPFLQFSFDSSDSDKTNQLTMESTQLNLQTVENFVNSSDNQSFTGNGNDQHAALCLIPNSETTAVLASGILSTSFIQPDKNTDGSNDLGIFTGDIGINNTDNTDIIDHIDNIDNIDDIINPTQLLTFHAATKLRLVEPKKGPDKSKLFVQSRTYSARRLTKITTFNDSLEDSTTTNSRQSTDCTSTSDESLFPVKSSFINQTTSIPPASGQTLNFESNLRYRSSDPASPAQNTALNQLQTNPTTDFSSLNNPSPTCSQFMLSSIYSFSKIPALPPPNSTLFLDSALHFSSSSLSLPDLSVNASHIQSNIPSRNDTINVDLRLNQPRSFRYNVNSPNHLNGSSQTVTLNQIKQPRSNVLLQNSICHQVSSSQYNSPQLASCPPQQPCSPNILPGPTNDVNSSLGSLSQSFLSNKCAFHDSEQQSDLAHRVLLRHVNASLNPSGLYSKELVPSDGDPNILQEWNVPSPLKSCSTKPVGPVVSTNFQSSTLKLHPVKQAVQLNRISFLQNGNSFRENVTIGDFATNVDTSNFSTDVMRLDFSKKVINRTVSTTENITKISTNVNKHNSPPTQDKLTKPLQNQSLISQNIPLPPKPLSNFLNVITPHSNHSPTNQPIQPETIPSSTTNLVSAQPVNSFANEELYQTPPQYFGSIDNCNITDSSSISPHLNVWNPNPPIQPALSEDSLRITDTRYSKHNKTEDSGPASWGAICEDSVAPEDSISQGLYNDDTSLDHPYPRLVPKLSEVIPGSLPPTFGPKNLFTKPNGLNSQAHLRRFVKINKAVKPRLIAVYDKNNILINDGTKHKLKHNFKNNTSKVQNKVLSKAKNKPSLTPKDKTSLVAAKAKSSLAIEDKDLETGISSTSNYKTPDESEDEWYKSRTRLPSIYRPTQKQTGLDAKKLHQKTKAKDLENIQPPNPANASSDEEHLGIIVQDALNTKEGTVLNNGQFADRNATLLIGKLTPENLKFKNSFQEVGLEFNSQLVWILHCHFDSIRGARLAPLSVFKRVNAYFVEYLGALINTLVERTWAFDYIYVILLEFTTQPTPNGLIAVASMCGLLCKVFDSKHSHKDIRAFEENCFGQLLKLACCSSAPETSNLESLNGNCSPAQNIATTLGYNNQNGTKANVEPHDDEEEQVRKAFSIKVHQLNQMPAGGSLNSKILDPQNSNNSTKEDVQDLAVYSYPARVTLTYILSRTQVTTTMAKRIVEVRNSAGDFFKVCKIPLRCFVVLWLKLMILQFPNASLGLGIAVSDAGEECLQTSTEPKKRFNVGYATVSNMSVDKDICGYNNCGSNEFSDEQGQFGEDDTNKGFVFRNPSVGLKCVNSAAVESDKSSDGTNDVPLQTIKPNGLSTNTLVNKDAGQDSDLDKKSEQEDRACLRLCFDEAVTIISLEHNTTIRNMYYQVFPDFNFKAARYPFTKTFSIASLLSILNAAPSHLLRDVMDIVLLSLNQYDPYGTSSEQKKGGKNRPSKTRGTKRKHGSLSNSHCCSNNSEKCNDFIENGSKRSFLRPGQKGPVKDYGGYLDGTRTCQSLDYNREFGSHASHRQGPSVIKIAKKQNQFRFGFGKLLKAHRRQKRWRNTKRAAGLGFLESAVRYIAPERRLKYENGSFGLDEKSRNKTIDMNEREVLNINAKDGVRDKCLESFYDDEYAFQSLDGYVIGREPCVGLGMSKESAFPENLHAELGKNLETVGIETETRTGSDSGFSFTTCSCCGHHNPKSRHRVDLLDATTWEQFESLDFESLILNTLVMSDYQSIYSSSNIAGEQNGSFTFRTKTTTKAQPQKKNPTLQSEFNIASTSLKKTDDFALDKKSTTFFDTREMQGNEPKKEICKPTSKLEMDTKFSTAVKNVLNNRKKIKAIDSLATLSMQSEPTTKFQEDHIYDCSSEEGLYYTFQNSIKSLFSKGIAKTQSVVKAKYASWNKWHTERRILKHPYALDGLNSNYSSHPYGPYGLSHGYPFHETRASSVYNAHPSWGRTSVRSAGQNNSTPWKSLRRSRMVQEPHSELYVINGLPHSSMLNENSMHFSNPWNSTKETLDAAGYRQTSLKNVFASNSSLDQQNTVQSDAAEHLQAGMNDKDNTFEPTEAEELEKVLKEYGTLSLDPNNYNFNTAEMWTSGVGEPKNMSFSNGNWLKSGYAVDDSRNPNEPGLSSIYDGQNDPIMQIRN